LYPALRLCNEEPGLEQYRPDDDIAQILGERRMQCFCISIPYRRNSACGQRQGGMQQEKQHEAGPDRTRMSRYNPVQLRTGFLFKLKEPRR